MTRLSLREHAQEMGIAPDYFDIAGQKHSASDAVLQTLLASLQETDLPEQYDSIQVLILGEMGEIRLPENFLQAEQAQLSDENGQTFTLKSPENGDIALPDEGLQMGYYTLKLYKENQTHTIFLIVAPPHAYQPEARPQTGLTVQLYALKSAQNWGVGEFADLARLAASLSQQNIDFIGINPIHALYTHRPNYASPYSPSSRLFLNPMYLHVPDVAAFLQDSTFAAWLKAHEAQVAALREAKAVDYAGVWQLKSAALRHLFDLFEFGKDPLSRQRRKQFTDFVTKKGTRLRGFALFETLNQYFGRDDALGWQAWDKAYHNPNGTEVHEFSAKNEHEIRFHMWLQWLCALQLAKVQAACKKNGVSLGLYGDLAVGSAQGSADTWLNRGAYCLDLAVGSPPDPFSPIGQNWQLPPLNPVALARSGCAEFIKIIRENMKLYGILRIDHVMALNRLWLIAGKDEAAKNGAYVHYPQEALFAIVALESQKNQCVVVGEDLGTVPDETRELLQRYCIFSYKALYFHQDTKNYPHHAIAVTSTHDLAPLAGFWEKTDLQQMFALGTLPSEADFQAACKQRERNKKQIIQQLKDKNILPQDFRQPETLTPDLRDAIQTLGATSPAQLYAFQLENLLNMKDLFNVPSVAEGNWRLKYPVPIEKLDEYYQSLKQICEVRMNTRHYPAPDVKEYNKINDLCHATHGDVFAYLGRHTVDGVGEAVRAFLPHAQDVNVVDLSGNLLAEMKKIDERGVWACVLPDNAPSHYLFKITENNQIFTQEDPYRFGSFLGDTDNWLLGEGKHLRPYEKLGAHLREINGIQGAYFAIWAPNAQRVSVIGEFNGWDGRVHVMRRHHDTGVWEIFIPNVKFNALYKFELRDKHGNIRVKSDPYAFAAELRPTTASVLRGLPEKMPVPAFRQKANAIDAPISIYEVHLGSWRRKADNSWLTYTELAEQLIDYVKEMGFTHIELLPISEFPFDGSWGYQATGLYAPTSRFGSPQELQFLVQKAHDKGISVILDWVVGHFPIDEHGLAKFDGTALYEHEDPREGFHQDWNTLIYNFGRHEVRNFLSGNALYWVEHFGFDGLRVDAVASMIYRDYSRKDGEWIPNQFGGRDNLEAIDFLRETNTMLQEQNLHVTGIAEESTAFPNVTKAEGLNFQFKWNMGWMNDTLRYMKEDPINRKYHHNLMTFGMMYQYSENYILPLSHDEVVHGKCSLLGKMPGDCWQKFANLRAYYGFMYGYPGKKLLFMGNEFAQGREWDFSGSLDWHLLEEEHGGGWHKGVQDFVKKLNHVYQEFAPLYQLDQWQEGFEWLVADDGNRSVFVFERKDREGNRLIVISNFTPVVREDYRFGVNVAGEYRVILNSDDDVYKGSEIQLSGSLKTENIESHGKKQSLSLTIPPLATVYLSCPKAKQQKVEPAKSSKYLKRKKK